VWEEKNMFIRLTTTTLLLVVGSLSAQAQDPAAPAAGGFAALVAAADPVKGQASAKKCVACHSLEQAGPAKVGPNLWGVVGRPIASLPDYKYSEAMVTYSAGGTKQWTIEELDPYLLDPRKHVPGTKMAFPGLKKDDERANVIAYLATLAAPPSQ
jgi:cytochrome c